MNETVFEYRGVDSLVYAKVLKDTKEELLLGEVKSLAPVASDEPTHDGRGLDVLYLKYYSQEE
jgi:hypothetical protein